VTQFPNIYVHMKRPEQWGAAVVYGYGVVTALVVPIGVFGYWAFGNYLKDVGTILAALELRGRGASIAAKGILRILTAQD
jgi:hypothetical protein